MNFGTANCWFSVHDRELSYRGKERTLGMCFPVPHVIPRSFTNMALVRETAFWLQSLILFVILVRNCSLNLIVNIKAKDGEIVQQTFFADPEKDYVTIDFKNNQGRFVTVYIDFRLVSLPLTMADSTETIGLFIEFKETNCFQRCHLQRVGPVI